MDKSWLPLVAEGPRSPVDNLAHAGQGLGEGAETVAQVLATDIPLGVDIAKLQAHPPAFLRQEPVPGVIADAEHQHFAEFRGEFEGIVVAIVAAQDSQPSALMGPFPAEAEEDG